MEIDRRNNLRRVVGKCRQLIEEDIASRLLYYGINIDGQFIPVKYLTQLNDENLEIKKKLEKSIDKEKCAVKNPKKAVERYIRHVSFTFINRIAALRAMEVRNLIEETIIRRNEYGGRSLRERHISEKNLGMHPDIALEESLKDAFREISNEIQVLFDLDSEYSIIFPSSKALRDMIQLLSEEVIEEDWLQDDVIGWIYQYYNEEARNEFRKKRRKNPTADDIPIISQFYTPDWIVKALTDNTLGKLRLEMMPESNIKDFCTYLIPDVKGKKREYKSVKNLKILDPACGSGHFLVYAFDVLYQIYLEDEPRIPKEEIPNLILENNIFGIDIDLRSVQLAALSLYLKAKTYNPNVKITKMNLVCADSHIATGEMRNNFLERFNHIPPLQDIFRRTFEDLNNTNEIGSLLKIREPFERLFNQLDDSKSYFKEGSGQSIISDKGAYVPQTRFKVSEVDKTLKVTQILTINEMFQKLKKFEQESIEKQDMGSLLFATETEKSLGLLSLLTQKYDIILMNPPHRNVLSSIKGYVKKNYPKTHQNYYSAFIEQGINLCEEDGLIGVLTGRALMVTKSFKELRGEVFVNNVTPIAILDLGFKTLEEAHALFAALILDMKNSTKNVKKNNQISFFDLSSYSWDAKRIAFEKCLKNYPSFEHVYVIPQNEFSEIPNTAYAYWAPRSLRSVFARFPPLDRDGAKEPQEPKIADAKQGLITADKDRFSRFHWEVLPNNIARNLDETFDGKKWVPFGEEFYLFYFYQDLPVVVNWENDGAEIKNYYGPTGKLRSRPQNTKFYFKPGLIWSAILQRTQLPTLWEIQRLPFRNFPEGCIFGTNAEAVIFNSDERWIMLGYMVSRLIFAVSRMINSENRQGTATTAALPIKFPFKKPDHISPLTKEAHDLIREQNVGDEISTIFIKPPILQVLHGFSQDETPITGHPISKKFEWASWDSLNNIRSIVGNTDMSLQELVKLCITREEMVESRIDVLQNLIDHEVYSIYEISDEDVTLIEREMTLRKGEVVSKDIGEDKSLSKEEIEKNFNEKAKDHVSRLISFYAKQSIEEDDDGIIPLNQLFEGVRNKLTSEFSEKRLEKLESEIYKILGKPLNVWLFEDFFNYHLNLYRKKPVYWQLTSSRIVNSREKLPGAFSCFVNYHKITRDTIQKVIEFHLKPEIELSIRERERALKELDKAQIEGNRSKINKKRKEYDLAASIVDEMEAFEERLNKIHDPRDDEIKLTKDPKWLNKKIKEIRDNGWNPVIDYGVKVNIEPLKEAKVLPKSADGVK